MPVIGTNLNITTGWFPPFILILAFVLVLASIHYQDGKWKKQLLWAVPTALLLTLGVWLFNAIFHPVGYSFPFKFFYWVLLSFFALCLAIFGWKVNNWGIRVVSIVAVLVCVTLLGVRVNMNYEYYPTLSSLFGQEAAHQSSLPQLKAIQQQVAKTGVLPSHGVTIEVQPPPTQSKFSAGPTYVYLPPAWFANPQPRLPVIELFPGIPGQSSDWTRAANADVTSDSFASKHQGKAPVLVMPDINGTANVDTECSDTTKFGKSQTYLTKDVPTYIIKTFNTQSNEGTTVNGTKVPSGWGVAGLSEGGTCAAMVALRYPNEYKMFAEYSGDTNPVYGEGDPGQPGVNQNTINVLYGGNAAAFYQNSPLSLLQGRFVGMGAWFAVGLQDDPHYVKATQSLHDLAAQPSARMASVCIDDFNGSHNFFFWAQAFTNSLPWMSWQLGLTEAPHALPVGASCIPPLH